MNKQKEVPETAALVTHGVYQYVRLPNEFRFAGDEVEIKRYRNGVLLKPVAAALAKRHKTAKS